MDARIEGARKRGRVEDLPLIRGVGRFSDDLRLTGECHAVFVRSPHAHARIVGLSIEDACAAPGVVAILTGKDMERAGIRNVSVPPSMEGRDGSKLVVPPRPALARERVMHVGEAVALVLAETRQASEDAAELVAIDYEMLPSVTATADAVLPDAPLLWREALGNVALDWAGPVPDQANDTEVDRLLAGARWRVTVEAVNQRIAGAPLEPRGATAEYDSASGRYTLHCGSQGTAPLRDQLARAMGVEPGTIRVRTADVGGGFGLKMPIYPEYVALLAAARIAGRPLHWMSSRSESFASDNQARDQVANAELALDEDGRFLALKIDAISNMGAFLSTNGAFIATANFARCFPTVYRIPRIAFSHRCVFTNTVPTGPYRGAGRPEANYLMERLVEAAARETGIDAVDLRRRNFLRPDAMPHKTAAGTTIDSGEFEPIFDKALQLARYGSFAERRAASERAGKLRGIGVSCFLEHAGAVGTESADLSFGEPGRLKLSLGVQASGQGHATVFGKLLARQLEIDPQDVTVFEGDSDLDLKGWPAVASRSAMTVSAAMDKTVRELVAKGKRIAARHLEAAEEDIVYREGAFEVAGTDRLVSLFDLAAVAREMQARGEAEENLDTRATTDVPQSFPNGCHIAEVEIDPDTGRLAILGYVAVDDCGVVLDHTIVEGQVVGSLAQGLGQVIGEHLVYERESGQLLTATFNDYVMPLATDMPPVLLDDHPVPCRTNPLGVKGVGEAGTTGALAAIMNAVAYAIPGGRGWDIDMPATPEKIWRACRKAP